MFWSDPMLLPFALFICHLRCLSLRYYTSNMNTSIGSCYFLVHGHTLADSVANMGNGCRSSWFILFGLVSFPGFRCHAWVLIMPCGLVMSTMIVRLKEARFGLWLVVSYWMDEPRMLDFCLVSYFFVRIIVWPDDVWSDVCFLSLLCYHAVWCHGCLL